MKLVKYLLDKKIAHTRKHMFKDVATNETIESIVDSRIAKDGPEANLNDIDVSEVTDMTNLFYAKDFRGDVSEWDVSNVKSFTRMFWSCSRFNCDISGWDVIRGNNFNEMFSGCIAFDKQIGKWDVSNATNMNRMFSGCRAFNQDLSKWDVSNVENTDFMFSTCLKFKGKGLDKWKLNSLKTMEYMFKDCHEFDISLNGWEIPDTVSTKNFNQDCPFLQSLKNQPRIKIIH